MQENGKRRRGIGGLLAWAIVLYILLVALRYLLKEPPPQEKTLPRDERNALLPETPATGAIWREQLPDTSSAEVTANGTLTDDVLTSTASEKIERSPEVDAYCVKCKEKRPIQDAHKTITKNGRHALEGTCPVCGTHVYRFIAAS